MFKDLFTMWKHTKMIMLTALTAAVYAAILIPLKGFPLIPGVTEFRPANAIPIVFALLFGPAGCWGAAIGNLIGDFFGTLSLGSLVAFPAQILKAWIIYKGWEMLGILRDKREPNIASGRQLVNYLLLVLLSSIVGGTWIGLGVQMVGMLPFTLLGPIISMNNFWAAAILGPILLVLMYPRVKRWGLLWTDIMPPEDRPDGPLPRIGTILQWIGGLGSFIGAVIVAVGVYDAPLLKGGDFAGQSPTVIVGLIFMLVFLVGAFLR